MSADQETARKHVVVMDNVPEWRAQVGNVVTEVFGDSVELHFAAGAAEALRIIEEIESLQGETATQVAMVLADLHISEDGEDNGDALLLSLMERGKPAPPTAIVSGTFMDETKRQLSENVHGLSLINKGAFRAMKKGTPERAALETNLRRMMDGKLPPLPNDPEIVGILRSMKEQLKNVSHMGMFIDQVASKVSYVWSKYADFLANVPAAEAFKACSLYDKGAITGHQLHEFKNYLPDFIESLKKTADVPADLVEELEDLSIYVTRVFAEVSAKDNAEKKSINLVGAVRGIVANFNHFAGNRVFMREPYEEDAGMEVDIAPEKLYSMLGEMIRNALRHCGGTVKVYIQNKKVVVENDYDGDGNFPLFIEGGNVLEGELPERSSSDLGSARGLRMLIEMTNQPDVAGRYVFFSLFQSCAGCVLAELDLSSVVAKKKLPAPVLPEECEGIKELPDVVFICHDHTPGETFKEILATQMEGFRYHCLQWPGGGVDGWCEEYEDLLQKACLVVAHIGPSEVESIITPLHRQFQHLVFLAANTMPENIQVEQYREYIQHDMHSFDGAARMLTQEELSDCEVGKEPRWLYSKSYSPAEWRRILHVAHEMAVKSKRAEGEQT